MEGSPSPIVNNSGRHGKAMGQTPKKVVDFNYFSLDMIIDKILCYRLIHAYDPTK